MNPLDAEFRTTRRRVLRLLYHAFRRTEAESREIEPFSLIYMAEHWQVGAFCRLRQGPRLFRLDRIERLDLLGGGDDVHRPTLSACGTFSAQ